MPTLLATLLAALSTPAHAVGVGSSVGVLAQDIGGFRPSLDLHFDPIVLQIEALDFIDALADEQFQLGINMYFDTVNADLPGKVTAVAQPGFGLDLFVDPTAVRASLECRVGGEWANNDGGFGIYVVPAVGFVFDNDEDNQLFFAGGAVQVSAWFGN